ncbi:hypothetical protein E4T42_08327 [Aureobasidium subglaciale]|nr:hypothetical protein E4T42_08327 [Aureobasidium subglaciale]
MLSRAALYALLLATCTITSTNATGYATRDPTTPVCSGFTTLTNTSHVFYSDANRVISSGVVCNASNVSTSCSVLSGGWSELYNHVSFANGTQITDQRYAVGWTVWNSTGDSRAVYNTAGYGAMENETVTFDQGTSGWVVFTPEYRCINGLIRNCPAKFTLANDTEVRVCYPMFTDRSVAFESTTGHFENISIIAGERFINETSVSAATQSKENPNNRPPYGLSSGDAAKMFIGFGGVLGLVVFWVSRIVPRSLYPSVSYAPILASADPASFQGCSLILRVLHHSPLPSGDSDVSFSRSVMELTGETFAHVIDISTLFLTVPLLSTTRRSVHLPAQVWFSAAVPVY